MMVKCVGPISLMLYMCLQRSKYLGNNAGGVGVLARVLGRNELSVSVSVSVSVRGRFRTARAQRVHSASYYGVYPGNSPENLPPLEACVSNSKLRNSNVSCSQNYPMSKTMQCRQ